ncbi:DUF202 domain-containing protein [Streptomyces sp. 4N509B]
MADVVRDPGVQPERTRLAWRRTTLALTLVVVLAGRKVVMADHGTRVAVVGLALEALLWVAFLVVAHRRIRALDRAEQPPAASGGTVWGAAGVVVVTSLLATVLLTAEA